MRQWLAEVAKSLTAVLVTGWALYSQAKSGGVTGDEWAGIAVPAALAGLGVWLVPNALSAKQVAQVLLQYGKGTSTPEQSEPPTI